MQKKLKILFFWFFFLLLRVRSPGRKKTGSPESGHLKICRTSGPDVMSGWALVHKKSYRGFIRDSSTVSSKVYLLAFVQLFITLYLVNWAIWRASSAETEKNMCASHKDLGILCELCMLISCYLVMLKLFGRRSNKVGSKTKGMISIIHGLHNFDTLQIRFCNTFL